MNEHESDAWEARVRAVAQTFVYPPTPDNARAHLPAPRQPMRRGALVPRVAWMVAALLLASVVAVPQVRSSLLDFFQIGAIRIQLSEATPTPPTPQGSDAPLLADLAGETTLAEAQAQVGFPLPLPGWPEGLGLPERVFVQELDGPAAILVWMEPDEPERVRLSLHVLRSEVWARKHAPLVAETEVHGQRALWVEGPHFIEVRGPGPEQVWAERQLVAGNVLIWTEGDLTYRLESGFSLSDAVRVAESLR